MSLRRLTTIVGAAGMAMLTVASVTSPAQTHKVTTPDSVVRAVGVYEWTGDLAKPTGSRFVPVTVFIDGAIEDAGVYLPRPVPFALLTGNIYELEDAGLAKGTVVLEQAMKTTSPDGAPAPAFTEGWTAYGSYKPPVLSEKKSSRLRASSTLPVIQTSGGKPHFSDKSADASKPDTTQKPATDDTTKKSGTSTDTSAKTSGDDDSRPTMRRRTGPPAPTVDDETSPPQDPNAASSTAPKSSDDDRAERPTLKRRSPEEMAKDQKEKKKEKESASVTAAGSMSDDPDRPRLQHGTRHAEDDEMPKLMGVPADMKQMVAVSDAKNRDPHPFARPWEDTAERAAILTRMQAFARAKLAQYGVVPGVDPVQTVVSAPAGEGSGPPTLKRGIPTGNTSAGSAPAASTAASKPAGSSDPAPPKLKRGIPTDDTTMTPDASSSRTGSATTAAKAQAASAAAKSKPTTSKTTAAHTTAKGKRATLKGPAQVELAGEELKGYLLSYGGAPTYVYMAHTVEPGNVTRYVTVVAQDDGMGQLKVAIASATDAAHLDRTPWMRFVDAVDVEASNRASLLFELRGHSSRQFALYRVIAAKPEQIFTTSM